MLPSVSSVSSTLHNLVPIASRILDDTTPCALFFSSDLFKKNIDSVQSAFTTTTNNTIAMKSNPLAVCLQIAKDKGMGCECASPCELQYALDLGFPPSKIVFDSPAKTRSDIQNALDFGVCINADNFDELNRIDAILASTHDGGGMKGLGNCKSQIGVRVNPQIGEGNIASTGTVAKTSKFGLPLEEIREELLDCFRRFKWLVGLHCHVGSQGCSVDLLIGGAKAIYNLAEDINKQETSRDQVRVLDIGGGLPVDYSSDLSGGECGQQGGEYPTPQSYVSALRSEVPGLFNESRYTLVTEFGRFLSAKCGLMISRVEYVKSAGGRRLAVVHCGADLFLRTAYQPHHWPHRVSGWSESGVFLDPSNADCCCCQWDVVGPLCFRGDIVAENVALPENILEGCHICIHDAGAYTLSMFSKYNSRQAPPVYGFRSVPVTDNGNESSITLFQITSGETVDEALQMWQSTSNVI